MAKNGKYCFLKEVLASHWCVLYYSSFTYSEKKPKTSDFIRVISFCVWEYLEQIGSVKHLPPGQKLKCLLFLHDNQSTMIFWRNSLAEKIWVLNKCFLIFQNQAEMDNIFSMLRKPVYVFFRLVFPSFTSSKISKAPYSTQLTAQKKWQFKVLEYKSLGKTGALFFLHSFELNLVSQRLWVQMETQKTATKSQNRFRENMRTYLHFSIWQHSSQYLHADEHIKYLFLVTP